METATNSSASGRPGAACTRFGLAGLATLALMSAGCAAKTPVAFAWLRPGPPPAGWPVVRIATGVAMPYPPGWRVLHGDAGTAAAALRGSGGHFLGYLNLTPRQGRETLANWASFRVRRNGREGDRKVTALAAATGLRFRTGHGACVRDAYTTRTGLHFIELACIVAGSRATSVIVGAAPSERWRQGSRLIERALSSFST